MTDKSPSRACLVRDFYVSLLDIAFSQSLFETWVMSWIISSLLMSCLSVCVWRPCGWWPESGAELYSQGSGITAAFCGRGTWPNLSGSPGGLGRSHIPSLSSLPTPHHQGTVAFKVLLISLCKKGSFGGLTFKHGRYLLTYLKVT